MTIPTDFGGWMQRRLLSQALDETPSTIAFFAGGDIASVPHNTNYRWQVEVDFVYRCLVCQLIEIENSFNVLI